jgi:hypothetical protein
MDRPPSFRKRGGSLLIRLFANQETDMPRYSAAAGGRRRRFSVIVFLTIFVMAQTADRYRGALTCAHDAC